MFYNIDGTRKNLIIFGTGTVAALAYYYFTNDSDYDVQAFCVDGEYLADNTGGGMFLSLPVVDFAEVNAIYPKEEYEMFVALGYQDMNRRRMEKYRAAKNKGYRLASYVSSRCMLMNGGKIGENCLIMEGSVIQPFATIGDNVIVWSGSIISHNSIIGDHCFLAAGSVVGGYADIGEACFIGLQAAVRDEARIGARCLVGAGCVLLEDAEPDGVYGNASSPRERFSSAAAMRFITI